MKLVFRLCFFLLLAASPTAGHSAPAAKIERTKKAAVLALSQARQGSRPSARGRSTSTEPAVKSVPQTHRQSKPQRVEAGARSAHSEVRSARGERTERTARSARSSRGTEGSRSARSGGSSRSAGAGSSRGHGRGH